MPAKTAMPAKTKYGAETAETTFPAMGTTAHVMVVGGRRCKLLDTARTRLVELESRWSRFLDTSELSQLNGSGGVPTIVSNDTFRLVATAVAAWHATGGRYDPGMLHEMAELGYDRTFAEIGARPTPPPANPSPANPSPANPSPANPFPAELFPAELFPADRYPSNPDPVPPVQRTSSVGSIRLDSVLRSVTLPAGTGLDPGGIGKGLAGDILCEELLAAGAEGALISLGGDVRVAGRSPRRDTWPISVADPANPSTELLRVEIPTGAVVTSSIVKRKWSDSEGNARHHLLDATTGQPVDNAIASVTVVAGEGWWAEALTKAVFSAGPDTAFEELHNASAVIVCRDGTRTCTPDLKEAMR